MPAPIPDHLWERFDFLVQQRNWTIKNAAKECGISERSGYARSKHMNLLLGGENRKKHKREGHIPEPRPLDKLPDTAKRALEEFSFYREHYLGRVSKPWQEEAARRVIEFLETDDDEYVVMNEPPGSGKSTTFTHDIVSWVIIRSRAQGHLVRVQIGSKTTRQAKYYVMHLKRTLERPYVLKDAEGCIAADFGRFKPDNAELWRGDEFIVEDLVGHAEDNREPTVQAISQEMGFLGSRANLVVWDDLVDQKNSRHAESRIALEEFWDQIAETRLEPGGLLLLQGQRIGADDLYAYALGKRTGVEEDMEEEDIASLPAKYHHVVFPAHDEDKCEKAHGKDAAPWPQGCLLDPVRLPWRKLVALKVNNPALYELTYQQRGDVGQTALVPRVYLEGGVCPQSGVILPGCFDRERDLAELPEDLRYRTMSIVTVDPSPANYWSIQWWLYEESTERRILMDLARRRMGANEFLDRLQDGSYVGLMVEWAERARNMGRQITHLIVERNAAQKFMLQYDFVRRWMKKERVLLLPHDTHSNKADPTYGVQATLPTAYRFGHVRIPYKAGSAAQRAVKPLVDEVTKWPEGRTEDCVMAHWFLEFNLSNLTFASRAPVKKATPSWVKARTMIRAQ